MRGSLVRARSASVNSAGRQWACMSIMDVSSCGSFNAGCGRNLPIASLPVHDIAQAANRTATGFHLKSRKVRVLHGLAEGVEAMATTVGKVLSVNVGTPREFEFNSRPARSAIWKTPVAGRVAVRGVNLAGDDQADRKAHGGPDKAVYAYAVEDVRWWEQQIGRSLAHGEFGENLTIEGIDANDALVGERWQVGNTMLEVSEPRIPCWRLGVRMN